MQEKREGYIAFEAADPLRYKAKDIACAHFKIMICKLVAFY